MNNHFAFTQLVGQTVNIYTLDNLIEQREIGAAYLAHERASRQIYRLVLFPLPSLLSAEERIVLLGSFQHQMREVMDVLSRDTTGAQHLLPLLDTGSFQNMLYYVTPVISQVTLTTWLAGQGPMNAFVAGQYLDQLASALEYAHHKALLHGDVTTDAIWCYPDGRCALTDLGVMPILQRIRSDQAPAAFYQARPNATPAPEQLLGQAIHTSTDVYALGALLYRLLTGHRVFGDVSPEQILEQHLYAPVPSLAIWQRVLSGHGDVTAALDALLSRAMAKDPLQRIQHPAQLANAYHQLIAPHDASRVPVASPLADSLVAPLPEVIETLEKPRSEAELQKEHLRKLAARRRALLFLGGSAVAAGVLTLGVKEMLGGRTTPSTVSSQSSGSSGVVQATTGTNAQVTATAAGSATSAPISGKVIGHAASIPVNSAITFPNPDPNSSQDGVLVHLSDNQFVAFDSSCTHHPDCAVQYVSQDKLLECPCHGAEFDPANHASVVQGPAPTPLAPIAITVYPDGTITVK
jgi:serine/threonine protein kinase